MLREMVAQRYEHAKIRLFLDRFDYRRALNSETPIVID
jgi:hypothetical protein